MKFYEKGFKTFRLESGERVHFLEMSLFKGLEDLIDIPNIENIVNISKYRTKKNFIQAAVHSFSKYDDFDLSHPITFGVNEEIRKMKREWDKIPKSKQDLILKIANRLDREKWIN